MAHDAYNELTAAYALDALDMAEARAYEEHLAGCNGCTAYLDQMRETIQLTGRLSAEAYTGAERVECRHEELAPGDRCPVCGIGWLYSLPPGNAVRIQGHALLSAIRYEVEKLRCSACGERFSAPLPEEAGDKK